MEVTESMLMSDTSASIAMLGGIHEMGVGLAIDDFGTGYSSLAQLKRFPVKILKIDKSFVDGLGHLRERRGHRGRHRPAVARPSGLVVLAEGVETPGPAAAGGRAGLRPLPGLPDVPAHPGRQRRLQQARRRLRAGIGRGGRHPARRQRVAARRPAADRRGRRAGRRYPSRSMMVALAWPPPSHMVWSP